MTDPNQLLSDLVRHLKKQSETKGGRHQQRLNLIIRRIQRVRTDIQVLY